MDSLREDRSRIADAIPAAHAQTCYRRRASGGGTDATGTLANARAAASQVTSAGADGSVSSVPVARQAGNTEHSRTAGRRGRRGARCAAPCPLRTQDTTAPRVGGHRHLERHASEASADDAQQLRPVDERHTYLRGELLCIGGVLVHGQTIDRSARIACWTP